MQVESDLLAQALGNLLKTSTPEECAVILSILGLERPQQEAVPVSTEDERKQAEEDQYADITLPAGKAFLESADSMMPDTLYQTVARFVPLRLEYAERRLLRLLESTIDSSEYTDRIDSTPPPKNDHQQHRHLALTLKNVCSVLSALVIAYDSSAESAKSVLEDRDFAKHEKLFKSIFEVARRYKILNPERMRESYVKMMYLLQDMMRPEVSELLGFHINETRVQTVHSLLRESSHGAEKGFALLSDPWLEKATTEIIPRGKSKYRVQDEIREKELAIKRLIAKYSATPLRSSRSRFSISSFLSSRGGDSSSEEEDRQKHSSSLSREKVERCIYSLSDYFSFLRFNQSPCERMIELLQQFFQPHRADDDLSACLSISDGTDGARLSHSHSRQYTFVLQSLTLWSEVMREMLPLWHAAETDLLNPNNPYVRTQTGQGLQRVQKAPTVLKLMTEILNRVQRRLGGWVGSSTIHLGDENVPNALMFIDKYMQVPRILGPIVLCIDKLQTSDQYPGVADIVTRMGGVETVQKCILRDFFKHGFDGGGASDFFSSGSCIDGRLTSAWNWCSKIESKEYFPIFQLTGFVGFDNAGK